MTRLRSCYQNPVADMALWKASIVTYWELIGQHYSADRLRQAFGEAWRRYPAWMPSAGQLVSLLEDPALQAAEAWPEVVRLASRSSIEHSDPVAREALIAMGGGSRLGRVTTAELQGPIRREFTERYVTVARTGPKEALQAPQEPPGSPGQVPGRGDT